MFAGLLWMGGILIAMGWFAIGWVARGQENRKYAESRLRYYAKQAVQDQQELTEGPAWRGSERVYPETPSVVNVYLTAPSVPAWQPQPTVIDGEVVRALPVGRKGRSPRGVRATGIR